MSLLKVKIQNIDVKTAILLIVFTLLCILAVINIQAIAGAFGQFISIVSPFIYGAIFAFIFQIPQGFYEEHLKIANEKKKRLVAIALSIITVLAIILLLCIIVIPQVVDNLSSLINNLPTMLDNATDYLKVLMEEYNLNKEVIGYIEDYLSKISSYLSSSLSSIIPTLINIIKELASGLTNILMGIVIAIYISIDKEKLQRQLDKVAYSIFNEKYYKYIREACILIVNTFKQFFAGQIIESLIIGILCFIGCLILDIPYASINAIIIGMTNIIPYFGPWIGCALSSILILFISPSKTIIFIIFSCILQQVESNLIYPHVVGSSVGLSALWVLFAITIGGGLFGIPGMIFGLPVFSVIYELFKRLINRLYKKKREKVISESN